ncbi:hypothetical protein L1887_36873 [Cichorium endivia]|nr:hypothetical protein L1887_36873 [Cichorium endivia]
MSNQQGPPSRPWFRLATMVRPPPPPPPAPTPTSQGPPPPPRPAFIRPAFAQTATQSNPSPTPPQPNPIPPPPQANPTPSPPLPATNAVARPTASAFSPPSPKPTQSSAPNTPPSQQSAPPLEILNSPPAAPQSESIQPSSQVTTTTTPISTTRAVTPPKINVKPLEQTAPPLPAVDVVTPPKIQKTPFSAPSPKPPQSPPAQQSAPPLSSPPPAPQSQPLAPSTTISPIKTTRTLTPPKVVTPLEQIPPPLPAVNVVTPPASPRIQKFPFSDPPPSPPNKTTLIPSSSFSPPRPPPLLQSQHSLPVSDSQQSRSIPPTSPPQFIKLPDKTSPTINPLSPLVLPSLKQKSYTEIHPESKQKTMHVQETPKDSANGVNAMHIAGNTHSSKHDIPRKSVTHKKPWDSQVVGKSVITIAGDNKGAIMRLTPSGNIKHEFDNNRHNPTSSNHEEKLETASEAKNKHQNSNPLLKTTFLNSNVQGVNNSILYNCYINHHDPGIHLTLSRKSNGDCGLHPKEHKNG